ncbi:MAG: helicase [Caudoviricetes sp.]|nr:MAG: helicase [Caudoviricetes sp.]
MNSLSFEDILLCQPELMDPAQGGLWWCESAEDIAAWPVNSVCLAGLAKWEDVQHCKDWICRYPFVFVASPNREFIDKVRQHVPWLPILSPVPETFGNYRSVVELVREYGTADLERRLLYKANIEPSSGLLNLADVKRRDLCDIPRTLSGFPTLDRALGGFRDGELTVWTGKRGEGKSTVLGQILVESVNQGRKVCAYSGELDADRFKDWILVQAAGPDMLEACQDPDTGANVYLVPSPVEALIDEWWDRKFYVYDLGISSAHDEDSILGEFEYARRCLGCDVFLVDNIMTARLKGDRDYYRAQSMFTRRLSEFCKAAKVHVHLVAHPRKVERGKSVEDSDEVSGTADITNLADNVISVRRLAEPGADGRDTELKVMKARESGVRGKTGLCFDPPSRRFYPPGGTPDKKYGWAYMRQQEFTECADASPFEG